MTASRSSSPAAPTSPSCFADTARYLTGRIVQHRRIADHTYRIRIECPEIASAAVPGQFAMLRIPDRNDPLLARPLAIYETFAHADDTVGQGDPACRRYADFIYLVHGKFTTALKEIAPGNTLVIWGPLGNGFTAVPPVDHLVLVAGGIGQTALLAIGRERLGRSVYGVPACQPRLARRVTLCWGARHAGMFGDADDFRAAGIDVHLATLDGSAGHRGTVVDLLEAVVGNDAASTHAVCCGPEGMMAAVSKWTSARGIPCHVSLEAPMACGVGICFTCVARVRDDSRDASGQGWDYRRTCIEGPVFEASRIVWEA